MRSGNRKKRRKGDSLFGSSQNRKRGEVAASNRSWNEGNMFRRAVVSRYEISLRYRTTLYKWILLHFAWNLEYESSNITKKYFYFFHSRLALSNVYFYYLWKARVHKKILILQSFDLATKISEALNRCSLVARKRDSLSDNVARGRNDGRIGWKIDTTSAVVWIRPLIKKQPAASLLAWPASD